MKALDKNQVRLYTSWKQDVFDLEARDVRSRGRGEMKEEVGRRKEEDDESALLLGCPKPTMPVQSWS